MFFILGINQGQKQLSFSQTIICRVCGQYGRYEVFMTYTCLSVFFIPLAKWGKRYFVKSSCCGTVYELNPEKGRLIARGEQVQIVENDLTFIKQQYRTWNNKKRCNRCGYESDAEFEFCPKCGNKL